MPRKFDHTVPSTLSAAQVHAALTTEGYWQARLDAIGIVLEIAQHLGERRRPFLQLAVILQRLTTQAMG